MILLFYAFRIYIIRDLLYGSDPRGGQWVITTTKKSGPITQVTRAGTRVVASSVLHRVNLRRVYDYNIIIVTMYYRKLILRSSIMQRYRPRVDKLIGSIYVTFPNTRHTYYNTAALLVAILYIYRAIFT